MIFLFILNHTRSGLNTSTLWGPLLSGENLYSYVGPLPSPFPDGVIDGCPFGILPITISEAFGKFFFNLSGPCSPISFNYILCAYSTYDRVIKPNNKNIAALIFVYLY